MTSHDVGLHVSVSIFISKLSDICKVSKYLNLDTGLHIIERKKERSSERDLIRKLTSTRVDVIYLIINYQPFKKKRTRTSAILCTV